MGKVVERKSGFGSTGKPCVIWLILAIRSNETKGTYIDKQVLHGESGFRGHLDLNAVLVFESTKVSQVRSAHRLLILIALTCRRPQGCTPLGQVFALARLRDQRSLLPNPPSPLLLPVLWLAKLSRRFRPLQSRSDSMSQSAKRSVLRAKIWLGEDGISDRQR